MNDITPEHAKWLDDAPKRIEQRVKDTWHSLRHGSVDFLRETVDRVLPDPTEFVEEVFQVVIDHAGRAEDLQEAVEDLIFEYLRADFAYTESLRVYDPISDSLSPGE